MTPLERKAHLTLQGQSLLDEWEQRCKLLMESSRLRSRGVKLRVEAHMLWRGAVDAAGLTMVWSSGTRCALSNGEIYHGTTGA